MKCKWCNADLELDLEIPECTRCWNIRNNAETNPKVALKIVSAINGGILAEAKQVLAPFAEVRTNKLTEDAGYDEFWMKVGHFRRAAEFIKKLEGIPAESE